MRLLFPILICLLNVSNSLQTDHNPECQPQIATKEYRDTLIIFLVDHNRFNKRKPPRWYVLKQLACDVPIASNIQTFVFDYGSYKPNDPIPIEDRHNSSTLIEKLLIGIEKSDFADADDPCTRLDGAFKTLLEQDVVKSHENARIVLPNLWSTCPYENVHPDQAIFVNFIESYNYNNAIYITEMGQGEVSKDEKIAPIDLKGMSKRLINYILDEKEVVECPTCSEDDPCSMKWLIGVCTAIISLVYMAIFWIWANN